MTRQTKKIFSWQIKNKNKNNVTNKKKISYITYTGYGILNWELSTIETVCDFQLHVHIPRGVPPLVFRNKDSY